MLTDPPPLPPHRARLGDRSHFPELTWRSYLNHAAISPPSAAVLDAMTRAVATMGRHGLAGYGAYVAQRRRLKAALARLIGADADQLALVASTSAGLSALALCQPWQPGDHLVVFTGEFPTNVTPWQQAAAAFAARTIRLPIADLARPDGPDYTRLDAALARGVRVVAISAVQFQTGLRAPLRALADRCHAHGARLCVDAIQAIGSTPLDVRAEGIDYLVCGSHKWLMGPEGCGFAYAAPDAATALVPRVAGWLSHPDAADFLFERGKLRYDKPIRPSLDFLELGASNVAGCAGLEAAVDALHQIGLDAIAAHIAAWHDSLEPALTERGFTSQRMPDKARRSGILSAAPPDDLTAKQIADALADRGVAVTTPDGLVRLSPHWPNALSEAPSVIDALDDALETLRG